MENENYIYLHIKETTGEPFYVGKGKNNRFKTFNNRNKHWHNIVNKHGFDIIFLETNLTEQEAFEKEIYWINRIGRKDLGLGPLVNFTNGGEGTSGRPMNKNTKEKLRNANLGKVTSEETKLKLSISLKGRPSPMKGKISKNAGKELSQETKNKISNSLKGKHTSVKTEFKKGYISKQNKRILDIETGVEYNSLKEAAQKLNIHITTLSYRIRNNKNNLKYI